MIWESVLVGFIVAAAVAYLGFRIASEIRAKPACHACPAARPQGSKTEAA